ncbi:MAG: hypothetical protein Q9208_008222 [Pyrenodesmia sp. 3 TL-2023]
MQNRATFSNVLQYDGVGGVDRPIAQGLERRDDPSGTLLVRVRVLFTDWANAARTRHLVLRRLTVSIGAAPSDAALVGTTTITPGNNRPGPPPDQKEQGDRYEVDHILELQFAVGAFQVNPRPYVFFQVPGRGDLVTQYILQWSLTGVLSIVLKDPLPFLWRIGTQRPKHVSPMRRTTHRMRRPLNYRRCGQTRYPADTDTRRKTTVASAFSNAFNLQGIPRRFNGFKLQVFKGRLRSEPGNPSDRTYPSDFGVALQKFLSDNEQDAYSVMDDVGKALADQNVGNYSAIKDYFTAYAQAEYQSAVTFLSTWVGTSYTGAPTSTRSTSSSAGAITTSAPPNAIGPLTDCSLVQTTITGTIAGGPQTYCQCDSVIAGINTETSGSLVYSVCAGAPYPTVATSTLAAPPAAPTCDCNENGCTDSSPACCGNGSCEDADPPAETPDLSSPACTACTSTLGASDCSADDGQCLIDQCKADQDCQACGIDCNTFG